MCPTLGISSATTAIGSNRKRNARKRRIGQKAAEQCFFVQVQAERLRGNIPVSIKWSLGVKLQNTPLSPGACTALCSKQCAIKGSKHSYYFPSPVFEACAGHALCLLLRVFVEDDNKACLPARTLVLSYGSDERLRTETAIQRKKNKKTVAVTTPASEHRPLVDTQHEDHPASARVASAVRDHRQLERCTQRAPPQDGGTFRPSCETRSFPTAPDQPNTPSTCPFLYTSYTLNRMLLQWRLFEWRLEYITSKLGV